MQAVLAWSSITVHIFEVVVLAQLLVERDWTGASQRTQVRSTARAVAMASGQSANSEMMEGYVIDNGCVRKNARDELLEAARTHTAKCALMGHCVESGYSLVNEDDRQIMLDADATPKVVNVVERSDTEKGIRLRVERECDDGEMQTVSVEEVER